MKRDIRIERFYAFPPERVFRAISDPTAMSEWLMPNDFQPKLGHRFQFKSKPQGNWNGVTDCEVIELDPPKRLAYTWSGQGKDGESRALRQTIVRWTLTAEAGGTRLVLEHTGFVGFSEVATSFLLGFGWKKKLTSVIPGMLAAMAA